MNPTTWLVFYQAFATAVVATLAATAITGGHMWRTLDVVVLGIGVFLVFGRIGCFHVACCHGRPARYGVRYGDRHVTAGFWARWQGRTLVPVQLLESFVSALLVALGIALSAEPGLGAVTYATGYAGFRLVVEQWRGDWVRPFAAGLSEAQWSSVVVAIACAAAVPAIATIAIAGCCAVTAVVLVATRRRRELWSMPHVRELAVACDDVAADPQHARRETRLGVAVTMHAMPDGRTDWVMSCGHPVWAGAARKLARELWDVADVVEGRAPGVVHVLTPEAPSRSRAR